MVTKKPKGLGRGLDALLGIDAEAINLLGQSAQESTSQHLPMSCLQTGKYQPRTRMDEGALNELAESIKRQGIMQPILVRPLPSGGAGRYEIIAGERRFRAAQIVGLTEVPVLIKNVADENAAAMALIENIQREDLNPLEEANGLRKLIDEFGMTHDTAADAIGRSRSATTNILRLLNLVEPVQTMLLAGDIDMGHARSLLTLEGTMQIQLANQVVANGWSVRETEKKVGKLKESNPKIKADNVSLSKQRDVTRVEDALSDALGVPVTLKANSRGKGSIQIAFNTWDGFNNLLEVLKLTEILKEK